MKQLVLVDLDDTLFHSWRREEFIQDGWDAYHAKSVDDEPVQEIINLVNGVHLAGFKVIGLTARNARFRSITMYKLIRHGVLIDLLLMRPDMDFRSDADVKVDQVAEFLGGKDQIKEQVAFIIDDREDVIKAFAALGVTTLHIQCSRD